MAGTRVNRSKASIGARKPMKVIVKFFANFREATGKGQDSIEGVKNIASLFDELVNRFGDKLAEQLYYPGTQEFREAVTILMNGRGLTLPHDIGTPLKDGDVVAIFPPVSGGKTDGGLFRLCPQTKESVKFCPTLCASRRVYGQDQLFGQSRLFRKL